MFGMVSSDTLKPRSMLMVKSNRETLANDLQRLSKLQTLLNKQVPDSTTNLFELMPNYWLWDNPVINDLTDLIDQLTPHHRLVFNAVMWDYDRFYKFVRTPSSIRHHHAVVNGNLKHTLEVCSNISKLANTNPKIDLSFMMLLGLLHDAGKVEEYTELRTGELKLSKRGRLLGHRLTIFEWIIEAYTKWNIPKDEEYLKLLHLLTAVKNIPAYLGYKTPKFDEFYFLSCCDNLSASLNYISTEQKNEITIVPRYGRGDACQKN